MGTTAGVDGLPPLPKGDGGGEGVSAPKTNAILLAGFEAAEIATAFRASQ